MKTYEGLTYGVCRRCGAPMLRTYRGWRHTDGTGDERACRTWRTFLRAGGVIPLPGWRRP